MASFIIISSIIGRNTYRVESMIKTSQMRSREEVLVLSSCRSFLEAYDNFGVDTHMHVDGEHPRRETPHHGSAIHAFTRLCCIELLERQL
jgi:hypothetical protein